MRVTLVRTGGLAGVRRETQLDERDLATEDAAALRQCFRRLRARKPKRPAAFPNPERDRYYYSLTIEELGSRRTISFAEGREPPRLRSLLTALHDRTARRQTDPEGN